MHKLVELSQPWASACLNLVEDKGVYLLIIYLSLRLFCGEIQFLLQLDFGGAQSFLAILEKSLLWLLAFHRRQFLLLYRYITRLLDRLREDLREKLVRMLI